MIPDYELFDMKRLMVINRLGNHYKLEQEEINEVVGNYGSTINNAIRLGQPVQFISDMLFKLYKDSLANHQFEFKF